MGRVIIIYTIEDVRKRTIKRVDLLRYGPRDLAFRQGFRQPIIINDGARARARTKLDRRGF